MCLNFSSGAEAVDASCCRKTAQGERALPEKPARLKAVPLDVTSWSGQHVFQKKATGIPFELLRGFRLRFAPAEACGAAFCGTFLAGCCPGMLRKRKRRLAVPLPPEWHRTHPAPAGCARSRLADCERRGRAVSAGRRDFEIRHRFSRRSAEQELRKWPHSTVL